MTLDQLTPNSGADSRKQSITLATSLSSDELNAEHNLARTEIGIISKLEDLSDLPPFRELDLSDPAKLKAAVGTLAQLQGRMQRRNPDYDILDETPEVILVRLTKGLDHEAAQERLSKQENDERIFMMIRDELKAGTYSDLAYFEAFQALLSSNTALRQKFVEIAAKRPDLEFNGVFSDRLEARIDLVDANIRALSLMAHSSPKYAAEIKQARVDVTKRAAVQAFILNSDFLSDASVDEATIDEVTRALNLNRPPYITSGTRLNTEVTQTRQDPVTGKLKPLYTEDRPLHVRPGVSAYSTTGRDVYLAARVGDHTFNRDVTGFSDEDKGLLAEALTFWSASEAFGTTGFVENVYNIDFSILGARSSFDPLKVNEIRQVLSHLVGGFEGYDGDIVDLQEKKTLLQNQARLLSDSQTAYGWENDQAGTLKTLGKLGLHDDQGHPNFEVIAAFGDYTQRHYGSGDPRQSDIVTYLHRLFPDKVELMELAA